MSDEQQEASKLWDSVNAWRGGFDNGPASRFCAASLDEFKQAVVAGARREAFEEVRLRAESAANDTMLCATAELRANSEGRREASLSMMVWAAEMRGVLPSEPTAAKTTPEEDAAWSAYLTFAGTLPPKYQARAGREARLLVDAVTTACQKTIGRSGSEADQPATAATTIKAEARLTGTWWRVRSLLLSLGEDERGEVLRGLGICLRCGADEAEIPSRSCTCARDE